jgi:hypothetical protein
MAVKARPSYHQPKRRACFLGSASGRGLESDSLGHGHGLDASVGGSGSRHNGGGSRGLGGGNGLRVAGSSTSSNADGDWLALVKLGTLVVTAAELGDEETVRTWKEDYPTHSKGSIGVSLVFQLVRVDSESTWKSTREVARVFKEVGGKGNTHHSWQSMAQHPRCFRRWCPGSQCQRSWSTAHGFRQHCSTAT